MKGLFTAAAVLALLAGTAMAQTPVTAQDAAPGVITTQPFPGGTVYADIAGHTLYTSDHDAKPGKSACDAACVRDWKPVPAAWMAKGDGDWTVLTRDDGTKQWAYQGKPLYTFAGDHKAGDTNG